MGIVACRVKEDVRDFGRGRGDDGHAADRSSKKTSERLITSCELTDLYPMVKLVSMP